MIFVFMWAFKYNFVLTFLQVEDQWRSAICQKMRGCHVGPMCLLGHHVACYGPHFPFLNKTSNCSNFLIRARIDASFDRCDQGNELFNLNLVREQSEHFDFELSSTLFVLCVSLEQPRSLCVKGTH